MNNDTILRRSVPTVARGLDALAGFVRFMRCRPRWLASFGVVLLLCGALWANSYFSAASQAKRRVRELGGYVGGTTGRVSILTRLLPHFPSETIVTGVVVEGKLANDADIAGFVAAFPRLEHLDLSVTRITDVSLQHVGRLGALSHLRARHTRVTDAGIAELAGLSQLQIVELDGTRITDDGVAELAKLPRLWTLSVSRTAITDAGLAHLYGKALHQLVLTDTQVTDAGVAAFQANNPRCNVIR